MYKSFLRNFNKIISNLFFDEFNLNDFTIHSRIKFIFICFCFIGFLYSFKIFYAVFFPENFSVNIKKDINISLIKKIRRNIYDRNGVILASSIPILSVAINTNNVYDKEKTISDILSVFPEISRSKLINAFESKKKFFWINRNIVPDQERKINEIGIPGLIFENEYTRVYPTSNIMSFIVGYVDIDQNGIAGAEKEFDEKLRSEDLYLSIDSRIQSIAHEILLKHIKEKRAEGGVVMIANLDKAEILASVSLPDFDPHYPSKYKNEELFNRATLGVYELGSVWKPMTIASALDSKKIKLSDKFDITPPLRIGKNIINDFLPPRDPVISVSEILKRSSNIGTSKIALKIGAELQREYFEKFGFFDLLRPGIPEVAKNIFPKRLSDISVATMSFGHGFAITPIHFLNAFSSIINDGFLCHNSFLIREVDFNKEKDCSKILSSKVSKQMRGLLRLVVEDGGAKRADAYIQGQDLYCVGGKTGTATKIKNGKYIKTEDLTSFVGAFPMYDPKYVVYVNLDNPKGSRIESTGGMAAAPLAKDIIDNIAPILGILIYEERCFFD